MIPQTLIFGKGAEWIVKILIIGGVAAGTKAAAKLKREDRGSEITILTKGKEISYAGCGLPYYIGKLIERKEQLIVNTPKQFSELTGVEVLTETEVTAIDREKKEVRATALRTGEQNTYPYDKLILASGASSVRPKIEGIGLKGVFCLRTPEDAESLRSYIETEAVKRAVVVGGGFIGLEAAENLLRLGVKVSVIDLLPYILPGYDPEISSFLMDHLSEHGIPVFTGTKLEAILGSGRVEKVRTERRAMKADAVVLAMGIRANTAYLEGSGIELMPNKTVKVNRQFQTNDPDIYALGDCACVTNRITGEPFWSPMGSSANIEGRMAALQISGEPEAYPGALGTSVVKLPELNAGRTGLTEADANKAGYDAVSVVSVVDDKAHYYPGAGQFIIKMIADRKTGGLLGVQVLGKGAVDKVVDVAVTAISLSASIDRLQDMDFSYAPPFSTAIHPIAHAANILRNKMCGKLETMTPKDLMDHLADDYQIIDASPSPAIPNADYVDLTKVNGVLPQYPTDSKLLLVCTRGKRAYLLQNRLKYFGYRNTRVLEGGLTFNQSYLMK